MTPRGSGAELRLGLRARELAPRARVSADDWRDDAGEARLVCRADALRADELVAFERSGARWRDPPAGEARAGERELVLSAPLLRALAREHAHPRALPSACEAAAVLEAAWSAATRPPPPPRLMGVLNVTPDSFSDGGLRLDPERAVEHGLLLARQGAALIDVGGESTRPGAEPVPLAEELRRVLPVVEGLARAGGLELSVDTRKSAVARAALERGARWINDVSAGRDDPRMLAVVAEHRAGFVAMHMQGEPRTMQRDPRYEDPVGEVLEHLRERAAACLAAGIAPERLVVDPGLGFGKRLEDNLALIARAGELRSLGLPLLLGPSRKSFLAKLAERAGTRLPSAPAQRIGGTLAAVVAGVLAGAEILRVHDVSEAADAVAVASALAPWRAARAREPSTP